MIVVVPAIVSSIYFGFFAIDRYVSGAKLAVRQSGGHEAPQLPGLAIMLGGVNPTSREETLYLREFITSADMLAALESDFPWFEHYSGVWRDPLYWLPTDASREKVVDYYQRVVRANFDEETGLLSVEVQAFDPKFSQLLLAAILKESERFINELSHKMAREQMSFADGELQKARDHYEDRRKAMLEFQSLNNFLDAEAAATSRAAVIAELEAAITMERAKLIALLSTLNASAPQVASQKNKIESLAKQLQIENNRLLSESGNERLNVVASKFRALTIDASIAEEAYKFAVTSVESARIEASKKIRSLVTVVSPNLPDAAIYPRRIYNMLALLMGLLLIYAIVRAVIATVEDHKD